MKVHRNFGFGGNVSGILVTTTPFWGRDVKVAYPLNFLKYYHCQEVCSGDVDDEF